MVVQFKYVFSQIWLIICLLILIQNNVATGLKIDLIPVKFNVLTNQSSTLTNLNNDTNLPIFKTIEGQFINVTIEMEYRTWQDMKYENLSLSCKMNYHLVSRVVNWTDIKLNETKGTNRTIQFDVMIYSKRLGKSFLKCDVSFIRNNTLWTKENDSILELIVNRIQTIAELIFRIVVMVFVIFLTFVMGCGLDRQIIADYFKRPISPLIGFASQFCLMPIIAFGLAKITGIDPAFGLGLLTIGCSPGGGASNIWTVLLGGDLNLSMTMTFLSSIAALFMMPFWLFVLGRFFIDPAIVKIPYMNIMLNLLQVVIPVGIGMAFRYKWNDKAIWIAKKVKMMGLVFVIFIMTYGTYANLYIYKLMGDYIFLLPIGALLPWLGFIFGGLAAYICRRKMTQCITIALETGFQNIGIAILILKFSMPQPNGDLGSTMPLIVAIFTPMPLYLILIGLTIKRKCFSPGKPPVEILDMDQDVEMQESEKFLPNHKEENLNNTQIKSNKKKNSMQEDQASIIDESDE